MLHTSNKLRVIGWNSELAIQQVFKVFSSFPEIEYELISLKPNVEKQGEMIDLSHQRQGIFTNELYQALVQNKADLAVYPANDLPYPLPFGLVLNALLDLSDSNIIDNQSHDGFLAVVTLQNRLDLNGIFSALDIKMRFGKVHLVGFGPGDPDLLTIRGDRLLAEADVIYHDDLVDQLFLNKYAAEKIYVGKRRQKHSFEQNQINNLMLGAALEGKRVVRLKGGDPMVFAHGGEEVEYLQRNFVDVEVVPGVSAAMAMASLSKIPLTHRDISSSVAFITGHSLNSPLPIVDTLVIYMGGSNISKIAAQAIEEGRDPATPVALVYNVSLPDQQEFFFSLEELVHNETKFPTPLIIMVGEVVSLRHHASENIRKLQSLAYI